MDEMIYSQSQSSGILQDKVSLLKESLSLPTPSITSDGEGTPGTTQRGWGGGRLAKIAASLYMHTNEWWDPSHGCHLLACLSWTNLSVISSAYLLF